MHAARIIKIYKAQNILTIFLFIVILILFSYILFFIYIKTIKNA